AWAMAVAAASCSSCWPRVPACHSPASPSGSGSRARSTVQVRLALVRCLTPVDLDRLLDHIGTIPGVERTNSSVLLATRIKGRDPT
ncbi:MAG: hypothetical protein V9G12_04320, partial [Microthrixaceae bacterium]